MGEGGVYLLDGRVLDGVGVVVVVNDLKVPHSLTLGSPSKVHIQLGLASSLGQHRKVSRLPNFHTWRANPKTVVRAWRTPNPTPASLTTGDPTQTPTCAVQPRALCLDLAGIMGRIHLDVEGAGRDLLDEEKAWSGWTKAAFETAPPRVSPKAHWVKLNQWLWYCPHDPQR